MFNKHAFRRTATTMLANTGMNIKTVQWELYFLEKFLTFQLSQTSVM